MPHHKQLIETGFPKEKKVVYVQAFPVGKSETIEFAIQTDRKLVPQFNKRNCRCSPPFNSKFTICYDNADLRDSWSWQNGERDWRRTKSFSDEINSFHDSYHDKKLWKEIFAEKRPSYDRGRPKMINKHLSYDISSICQEAQGRLREIGKDDFFEIFRFRLKGKFRFYGLTIGSVFLALWHDPNHKIYPVD